MEYIGRVSKEMCWVSVRWDSMEYLRWMSMGCVSTVYMCEVSARAG